MAFTLLQFDSHSIDTLYSGAKLSDVERLTPESYQPRAYTPLIDACVKTIKATEETIATRRDKARVIVVFQTDGEENASRRHTLDELRDLIERRKAEGWQFIFLGADMNAYKTASNFGILKEATLAYSGKQSLGGMTAAAESSLGYILREEPARFSQRQKRAAGDQYTGRPNRPNRKQWPFRTAASVGRFPPAILPSCTPLSPRAEENLASSLKPRTARQRRGN